jgi:hypothetical protein
MPFNEVAREIIKHSFRSAIFIDDKMVDAYSNENTSPNFNFCKQIYDDFQNNYCSLDIYNFKDYNTWLSKKDFHLKKKDLLIIDWVLKDHDPTFSDSLRIIEQAIKSENLHFICIYTDIPEVEIESKIIYRINAYFNNYDANKYKNLVAKIDSKFEDEGHDVENFKISLKSKSKDLDLYKNDRTLSQKIIKEISDSLITINPVLEKWFKDEILIKTKEPHKDILIKLGYFLNECLVSKDHDGVKIKNISTNSFLIQETAIIIFNKSHINPSDLHAEFSSAILKGRNNFMTILGLEIRTLLMDSSAFIGNEIDSIEEEAFFHHESRASSKEEFFAFLKQIWQEQSSSYLLGKDLKILDLLDDYKAKNNIDKRLAEVNWADGNKQQNLAKLNYHYNILFNKRNSKDFIRFGDLFELHKKGFDYDLHSENTFLLNITAHCDCLRPEEKIKSNFFFVLGKKDNLEAMLKRQDDDFNSYIMHNNIPIVIKWSTKPYSIYVDQKKNHIDESIPIDYFGSIGYLKYLCTIKENYTQRISNQSFAYASRVGIFFTGLKTDKK